MRIVDAGARGVHTWREVPGTTSPRVSQLSVDPKLHVIQTGLQVTGKLLLTGVH